VPARRDNTKLKNRFLAVGLYGFIFCPCLAKGCRLHPSREGGSGIQYPLSKIPHHQDSTKQRTPAFSGWGSIKKGDDILSHITAVPSAQAGLTSLFGMGRGEPRRNNHLKSLVALGNLHAYRIFKKKQIAA
jgi:hypothetical protein